MERDDTTRDRVETIKHDTDDLFDETKERAQAGVEKAKRAVQGDDMSLGDRVASHVKEMGHDARAESEKAEREGRDGGGR